ncbi:hypothetical protein [Escherichia coli]|uniref:hypothetical protein n=1 Tax=Escherichia coli TaxID=562 RepID=UPI00388F8F8F
MTTRNLLRRHVMEFFAIAISPDVGSVVQFSEASTAPCPPHTGCRSKTRDTLVDGIKLHCHPRTGIHHGLPGDSLAWLNVSPAATPVALESVSMRSAVVQTDYRKERFY